MSTYNAWASVVEDPIRELAVWEWMLAEKDLTFAEKIHVAEQINKLRKRHSEPSTGVAV